MKEKEYRAKKYLGRIKLLDAKIDNKVQELKELRHRVESLSSVTLTANKVQMSPEYDRIGKNVAKILEIEENIVKQCKEMEKEKHKMIDEIGSLKNPLHVSILFKRYIEFKSIEKIADELNYSCVHIKRCHGDALNEFEKVIPNDTLKGDIMIK